MRSGGVASSNLFISNPIGIHIGGGTTPEDEGVAASMSNNLVMYGRDLDENNPRGFGLWVSNIREADIRSNFFYKSSYGYNHSAITLGGDRGLMVQGINLENNLILDWNGSINIAAPQANQIIENISITQNTIYRNFSSNSASSNYIHPLVQLFADWNNSVDLQSNTYYMYNPSENPFSVGNTPVSDEHWSAAIEPTSLISSTSSTPAPAGIDVYLNEIGYPGDFHEFIRHARGLSRNQFDHRFTSHAVISWFSERVNSQEMLP